MQARSKQELRNDAKERRDAEEHRLISSREIAARLSAVPEYQRAKCICCYVSFRSEVETHELARRILQSDRKLVVPWCDGPILQLTEIQKWAELAPRTMGILEPVPEIRKTEERSRQIENCDLVLIPGLAFTRSGDRLGYGAGHYDRLLETATCCKVALAFACQLMPEIPVEPTDIRMDMIVTQSETIRCS